MVDGSGEVVMVAVMVVVEGWSRRFVALAIAWLEWQKGRCLAYWPTGNNDLMEVRHAHMANRSYPHYRFAPGSNPSNSLTFLI